MQSEKSSKKAEFDEAGACKRTGNTTAKQAKVLLVEFAFIVKAENIAALSVWDDCTDRLQRPHPQNLLGNTQSNVVSMYFGFFSVFFCCWTLDRSSRITGKRSMQW